MIAKTFLAYIINVAIQYYCVVRKRFLCLDTSPLVAFNQAYPDFVVMMFFLYDQHTPEEDDSWNLTTQVGLYQFACKVGMYTFCKTVCEQLTKDDILFNWTTQSYKKVFTNIWMHLHQARFREQYITGYVSSVAAVSRGVESAPTSSLINSGIAYHEEQNTPIRLKPKQMDFE